MSTRCSVIVLLTLLGCIWTGPLQAQPTRVSSQFYLRFGQGVSDFAGDASPVAGVGDFYDTEKFTESEDFQYVLVTELGYQFTPSLSLGVGYQFGTYYLRGQSTELQTAQLLGRYMLGARNWSVAPYVDLGGHVSTGTEQLAYGPSMGGGLDITLNNQISFFVESRLNLTFPDGAADPGRLGVPFDVLSALPAIGAKMILRSTPDAPRVRQIDGPTTLQVGETATYSATINAESATQPIERTWTFGDGGQGRGLTSLHIFRKPGTYTVLFEAKNKAGSDSKTLTVTVEPAPDKARLTSVKVAPNPAEVGGDVLFRAEASGDPPLSYEWRFGDGTQKSGQFVSHAYDEAGEYKIQLTVSNQVGQASRTVQLHVDSAQADPNLGPYTVQIGAFSKRSNAEDKALKVLFDGFPARIQSIVREGKILYRVWAGNFKTEQAAKRTLDRFRVYAPDAFVKATTPVDGPNEK